MKSYSLYVDKPREMAIQNIHYLIKWITYQVYMP